MTTHVVCLDGTGQMRPQPDPTNISLIFDAMGGDIAPADNHSFESTLVVNGATVQLGKYLAGVGTGGIPLFDILKRGDGEGIAEQIVRGYTFLSRSYQPGDDLIIVGFSRGAAAARCLAGFVVGQGLLNPARYDPRDKQSAYLRGVAAWYKYRLNRPDLVKFQHLTNISVQLGQQVPALADGDFIPVERVLAVGVFDTVSSLGVPRPVLGGLSYDFDIADTALNPKVLNGFHALSADEDRANFTPTLWTARHNITQVIFPGCHSDVGGGYAETGLSDGALTWMLAKLRACGLRFDLAHLGRPIKPDPMGQGHDESFKPPWNLLPPKPREFSADLFEGAPAFAVDASIGQRWGKSVTLLPGSRSRIYQSSAFFSGGGPLYKAGA